MPLTQDYTYQLGLDGVTLNTDETFANFVDITRVDGLDSAPPRSTERDHEGVDGGFMDAEYEKGRAVSLEGMVYSVDSPLEPYLDKLKANWAVSTSVVPLFIKKPGVAERVLFVKPLGCRYDHNESARLGQAKIQFQAYAEDPRQYDAQLVSANIYQGEQVITGRGYPRGYPYGYGINTSVVGTYLTVGGNRPTPPIFILQGPIERPRIVNETTGEEMIFDISLNVNDSLIVDAQNRTIKLNGENRRAALRNPSWFFLQPGQNYIRYRAESFYTTEGPQLNANANFDTAVSPWTGNGCAITVDTSKFHLAPQALLATPDGVTNNVEIRSELFPVEVGTQYVAEVWMNPAVTRTAYLKINWYNGDNVAFTNDQTSSTVVANTWTKVTTTAKAPTNTVNAQIVIGMSGTPAAGHLLSIDEAKMYGQFPSILNAQFRSAWR